MKAKRPVNRDPRAVRILAERLDVPEESIRSLPKTRLERDVEVELAWQNFRDELARTPPVRCFIRFVEWLNRRLEGRK